jgi:hypothetical protein
VLRVGHARDGHRVYFEAVESTFNEDIEYAKLAKISKSRSDGETRYSPAKCIGCEIKPVAQARNEPRVLYPACQPCVAWCRRISLILRQRFNAGVEAHDGITGCA